MNGERKMPLINGVLYGWSSISLNIAGTPTVGVTAINYKTTQTKENKYGASQYPIGRGYGRIEVEASVTLMMDVVESIRQASPTGTLTDILPFDIIVTYKRPGSPNLVQHIIKNCEFTEDPIDVKEGDTSIEVALPLIASEIVK